MKTNPPKYKQLRKIGTKFTYNDTGVIYKIEEYSDDDPEFDYELWGPDPIDGKDFYIEVIGKSHRFMYARPDEPKNPHPPEEIDWDKLTIIH